MIVRAKVTATLMIVNTRTLYLGGCVWLLISVLGDAGAWELKLRRLLETDDPRPK